MMKNFLKKELLFNCLLIVVLIFSSNHVQGQILPEPRETLNINKDWYYLEDNSEKLEEIHSKKHWIEIDLPHSWNSLDATDLEPGYRRDASWYKKEIKFSEINPEKRYQLFFEGSNAKTEVFVNGEFAGKHVGGYLGFKIDLDPWIKLGENEILVRVDNGFDPEIIPSQKSDFFIFGGITRDVWLLAHPKNGVEQIKVTMPKVSKKEAELIVNINLISNTNKEFSIKAILTDPNGNVVGTKTINSKEKDNSLIFNKIKNPKLWDTEHPNLYKLDVQLWDGKNLIDEVSERTGFRWFEFKDHGAFYLNGERLVIRGTHRHEEHAGVGAAMNNEQHYEDLKMIKSMGANFVRLAHYPQDPEVYKACDELGLLVWDELPWCRGGVGNEIWQENTKNMLTEMIEQNYNHPSIIIWSLGNEMYWLPDFEDGDSPKKINAFLEEINALAHQLDPYRKTAVRKYYEGAHLVDVFSPSIWSGWYSGSYKSYQKAIDTYKKEYKHFIHAEYGGSSHVGRHTENPITGEGVIQADGWEEEIVQTQIDNIAKIGDWSENYIVDLFDWHLRISETDPTFVGNIQWAFKDFGTPLRPENAIPYMNQKGLADRNGKPKDAYYVFKSYWSDEPFVYIESHTWTDREGPKDKTRNLSVYSNCQEVQLIQDGKDLGTKTKDISKFPASGLTWDLNFKEGQNELIAIGITSGRKKVFDTLKVNYRFIKNESPKELRLSYSWLDNGRILVSAEAIDKNGLRCLDYENKVYFQCLSGGETLKNQGTPTGSEVIAMANGKASIEVMPSPKQNKIIMMVLNQDFKGTYLEIPVN